MGIKEHPPATSEETVSVLKRRLDLLLDHDLSGMSYEAKILQGRKVEEARIEYQLARTAVATCDDPGEECVGKPSDTVPAKMA